MKTLFNRNILTGLIFTIASIPGLVWSAQQTGIGEDLSGFYSRLGNNGSSSKTTRNNIYIKLFEDRWVALLFIPYPYATSVEASTITRVFEQAKGQTSGAAYMKGTFGYLKQKATIQLERYGYLQDRLVFECGSLSPCTIKLGEGYIELIKPGVINEHIIRYNHVSTP